MIAIIDYNAGNTCSVINALNRLNVAYELTSDHHKIRNAEKIILPGVGHAKSAMDNLINRDLVEVLQECEQPFLGICVGMQLMAERSTEGPTETLKIIRIEVDRFHFTSNELKVPHMGWNQISITQNHPIFKGIENNSFVYFVHSYYMPKNQNTIATTDYGISYSSVVLKNNFIGVQFHPEKSGPVGAKLLKNFIEL
jgi:glutamine amidotransferase